MIGDLAFLPLEVFIVVLVIERILNRREKQAMLQKLNMVIGAFFSEIGNYLLFDLLKYFDNKKEISSNLNISDSWTKKDYKKSADFASHLKIDLDCSNVDLVKLKEYLSQKRVFLLTLLENPSLLEHDRFTLLLWAITHVDEELEARPSLNELPDSDLKHIADDIIRLYDNLASEWIDYVDYLKSNYPFLYSLVLRTHPFQEHPSSIIISSR
ncbi:MAG: hypothetical protein PHQ86_04935 [Dehalococcoidales bacterium]|nr:hypothetical protein [Dehalococcoidales bacterium]